MCDTAICHRPTLLFSDVTDGYNSYCPCTTPLDTSSDGYVQSVPCQQDASHSYYFFVTAQGPVRSSAFGTYNRVVMLAIDAHPAALYTFQWYLKHIWRHEDLLVFSHTPETPTLVNVYFKKRPIHVSMCFFYSLLFYSLIIVILLYIMLYIAFVS